MQMKWVMLQLLPTYGALSTRSLAPAASTDGLFASIFFFNDTATTEIYTLSLHDALPIQTSRILLYATYFFAGVGVGAMSLRGGLLAENGELARRWPVWFAFVLVFYAAILALVYARHYWVAVLDSPPLLW